MTAAFEAWFKKYHDDACREYGGLDCTNPKGIAEEAWDAAEASLRVVAPPVPTWPPCRGVPRAGCNYLAARDTVCNKCGEVHRFPITQPASEPVAWMDDFGNVFPLAANKGAGSWMDEHKRNWKPLYATPQPAAKPLFGEMIAAHPGLREEMLAESERERERFEAWAQARDNTHGAKIVSEVIGLDYPLGRLLWEAWLARASLPPAPEPVAGWQWAPVAERMPPSGQTVLAFYLNSNGNERRVRAQWIAAKSCESGCESDIGEYDEATDTYYDAEGWYEQIDNWDLYSAVAMFEVNVTHWMPLPPAPLAAECLLCAVAIRAMKGKP